MSRGVYQQKVRQLTKQCGNIVSSCAISKMLIFRKKLCFITWIAIASKAVLAEEEEAKCKEVDTQSPYLRLKNNLLCNYDIEVRPTVPDQENATEIELFLEPQNLEYVSCTR